MRLLTLSGRSGQAIAALLVAGLSLASPATNYAQVLPRNDRADRELACRVVGALGSGQWGQSADRFWRVSIFRKDSVNPRQATLDGYAPSRIEVWRWDRNAPARELAFDLRDPFVHLAWLPHDDYIAAFKHPDRRQWPVILKARDGRKLESWSLEDQKWNLYLRKASRNGKYVGVCADPDWGAREYSLDSTMQECRAGLIDIEARKLTWVTDFRGMGVNSNVIPASGGNVIALGPYETETGFQVAVCDVARRNMLWSRQFDSVPSCACFSPNGDVLHVGGIGPCVLTLDARSGKTLLTWIVTPNGELEKPFGGPSASCLDVSPDGDFLAVGTAEGDIYVRSKATGGIARLFHEHGHVLLVTFSPDSQNLATSMRDTIKIWSRKSWGGTPGAGVNIERESLK